jgi:hypothetical protein
MDDATKAALADVYERAAEYAEEWGWTQGRAGEYGEPRCFMGLTASAVGEVKNQYGGWTLVDGPLWHRANEFAESVLESAAIEWNDEEGRTKDEVINTLHALANKLR